MNHKEYLENFQNDLKKIIVDDTDEGIELLDNIIKNESPMKNNLYILKGQHIALQKKIISGIISVENQFLHQNKIQNLILLFIDEIGFDDINTASEFIQRNDIFKENYQLYINENKKAGITNKQGVTEKIPIPKNGMDTMYEIKDNYEKTILFYPLVNRKLNSDIFKKKADDKFLSILNDNIDDLIHIKKRHDINRNNLKILMDENIDLALKLKRKLDRFENTRVLLKSENIQEINTLIKLLDEMDGMTKK